MKFEINKSPVYIKRPGLEFLKTLSFDKYFKHRNNLVTSDEFELEFPELSRAELGHFNFRAETELWIFYVRIPFQ